jgi:hypothetical protein
LCFVSHQHDQNLDRNFSPGEQTNKTKQKDMIANADNATSFFRCSDYFTAFIAKSCDSDTIWVALNETSLHTTFFLLFNIFFTLHSVKVKDEKKKKCMPNIFLDHHRQLTRKQLSSNFTSASQKSAKGLPSWQRIESHALSFQHV